VSFTQTEKVGVLAIRIWVEQASPHQLRARITSTTDVEGRNEVIATATTADEIEKAVGQWFHAYVTSLGADEGALAVAGPNEL
jgi:hypothetical protein